jgi:hypothetical protein
MLPVACAAAHMGHSNHVDVVLPNTLGNFVPEPGDSKLPAGEKTCSRGAGLGVRSNQADGRGHGIVQLAAKPGSGDSYLVSANQFPEEQTAQSKPGSCPPRPKRLVSSRVQRATIQAAAARESSHDFHPG